MPNRQIGTASSTEETLLWEIGKQLDRLTQVIATSGGGGTGTVTSVSVVSTNGFAGSVATATTTPAITISTTITGIIKGNGTALSAAVAGTDYLAPNGSGAALTGVWLSASGTTLVGANTIVQAGFNTTFTGIGKVTFSPTTGGGSIAGLNVGTVASDPTTLASADLWHNSSVGQLKYRQGASSLTITTQAGVLTATRIPVGFTTAGVVGLADSANLTFVTNRILGTTLYLTLSAGTATAGTCPLLMTSGTVLTTAISGGIEYNNTFHMTNSDATRRHVVLAVSATKTTAGAPYTNDGYITVSIGGTDVRVMTTA